MIRREMGRHLSRTRKSRPDLCVSRMVMHQSRS